MDQNNQKHYSFINLKPCINSRGETVVSVTTVGTVRHLQETKQIPSSNGDGTVNAVRNFSMPLSNVDQMIARAFSGTAPTVSTNPNYPEDATVWADVAMWNKLEERFSKFIAKAGEGARILIVGTMSLRQDTAQDGSPIMRVRIMADDFFSIPSPSQQSNQQGAAQPTVPQPTVPQPTTPQPTVPQPTTPQPTVPRQVTQQPFVEIAADDDELPF